MSPLVKGGQGGVDEYQYENVDIVFPITFAVTIGGWQATTCYKQFIASSVNIQSISTSSMHLTKSHTTGSYWLVFGR